MIPAYVLTGLFLCVWIVQRFAPISGIVKQRRVIKRVVAGFAIALCIVGMAFSVALPLLVPVFAFPRPAGPYGIGTVTYHWTDSSRREAFSPDKNRHRELMVQVWYPARKDASSSYAPYIPDADAMAADLALYNFPTFVLSHIKYVKTHAIEAAPIASARPRYPVLIFLEGLTGYRQMNTFQVEELVSHGYIVVGIDQPGAAASVIFPDGHHIAGFPKTQMDPLINQSLSPTSEAPQLNGQVFPDGIIPYFAQDVSFTLDQLTALNRQDPRHLLTGKLDLQHTGLFGVSLGGMVGGEACKSDPRLAACLLMDVAMTADVVEKGLQQPSMWLTRPADSMRLERQHLGDWPEKDIQQTQTTMRSVYTRLPADGYFVQIPGTFHLDFTDVDLFSPAFPKLGFTGPIGSQRAHEIINAYTLAFFDKHLKNEPEALLTGSSSPYPEVTFEAHR
jgi:predicted dienelactone hydrolase